MAKKFKSYRKYELASVQDLWAVYEVVYDTVIPEVRDRLEQADLYVHVAVEGGDGIKFVGTDLRDVLAEAQAESVEPATVASSALVMDLSTNILILGQAHPSVLNLTLEGEEGFIRALASRLDRIVMPHVVTEEPRPREVEPRPTHAGVAKHPNWLQRNWRDHTAVFVVTVVGTIVAGVILAALNIGG